ncbi:MAG: pirin family protein [Gammaproteobacteria bacterium]
MIEIRRGDERGRGDYGWLQTRYSFSFAEYHDPAHMGFGPLRVINEDHIAGGGGFPPHSHRDMEILTWIVDGALAHRDSMGNGSVIGTDELQYMAAGTGVRHSEYNASETDSVHLLQIWILPNTAGHRPRYGQTKLAAGAADNGLALLAAPDGAGAPIAIHQDARLYIARLSAGTPLTHALGNDRRAWLQSIRGEASLNGRPLGAGDGAAVTDERQLEITAERDTEFLLFDMK